MADNRSDFDAFLEEVSRRALFSTDTREIAKYVFLADGGVGDEIRTAMGPYPIIASMLARWAPIRIGAIEVVLNLKKEDGQAVSISRLVDVEGRKVFSEPAESEGETDDLPFVVAMPVSHPKITGIEKAGSREFVDERLTAYRDPRVILPLPDPAIFGPFGLPNMPIDPVAAPSAPRPTTGTSMETATMGHTTSGIDGGDDADKIDSDEHGDPHLDMPTPQNLYSWI